MKQQDFEARYSQRWEELEYLIDGNNVESEALAKLPEYYRQVCHHLALAKHRHYSAQLVERLNSLTLRSHNRFYQHSTRFKHQLLRFVVYEFPRVLRANKIYIAIATLCFVLPMLLMGVFCYTDEGGIYSIMAPEQVSEFESMYDPENDHIGRERQADTDLMMFGFYIKNNIGISFRTFATGILFGVGSLFFLIFNGVFIGGAGGHLTQLGYTDTFYPFVIGHGAFELTAIVFSGAAGLKLGYALINPGPYRRLTALRISGKDAVKIIYGSTIMLIIAAFLEAFWSSSSSIPNVVKYSVGAVFWALMIGYCFFAGRGDGSQPN